MSFGIFKFIFLLFLMVKIVFSESRNCLIQLDTNQTAWVTYEDSLHACVQCVATNQRPIASEIISINELETSKCCNGQITLKEDCLEGSTSLQCHNLTECINKEATSCEYITCNTTHNGLLCLPNNQVCDGLKDCEKGEDETGCSWYQGWCDGFMCPNPHPECLPLSKVCDSHKDCLDGSDEVNCEFCPNQFRCQNFSRGDIESAECYNPRRVCDQVKDCQNGEDENNCFRWTEWANWSSSCPNSLNKRERTRSCVGFDNLSVSVDHCLNTTDDKNGNKQTESCQSTSSTTVSTSLPFTSQPSSIILVSNTTISTTNQPTTTVGINPSTKYSPIITGLSLQFQIILIIIACILTICLIAIIIYLIVSRIRKSGKWVPSKESSKVVPTSSYSNQAYQQNELPFKVVTTKTSDSPQNYLKVENKKSNQLDYNTTKFDSNKQTEPTIII